MLFLRPFLTTTAPRRSRNTKNSDPISFLVAGHKGAIDLLLAYVEMPGMDGFELAAALKKLRPETRVLFMSGREWRAEVSDKDFVLKPFRIETLLDKVREILRKRHQ